MKFINCKYWSHNNNKSNCGINFYSGEPSNKDCGWCLASKRNTISIGLGDTLAKIFFYFGLKRFQKFLLRKKKKCRCPSRQRKLNNLWPYKKNIQKLQKNSQNITNTVTNKRRIKAAIVDHPKLGRVSFIPRQSSND